MQNFRPSTDINRIYSVTSDRTYNETKSAYYFIVTADIPFISGTIWDDIERVMNHVR